MNKIKNVLFDLDGTLLNSIADITYCVNTALNHFKLPNMDIKTVSLCVGGGWELLVNTIFERLSLLCEDKQYLSSIKDEFRKYYMDVYTKNSVVYGTLYDGVKTGIEKLYDSGLNLYVLSNKPNHIANDCIKILGIEKYFKKVIGDGYYNARKPNLELWHNLEKDFKMKKDDTVMVGDGIQDILFARNVSIDVLVVLYGGITDNKVLFDMKEKNYFKSFNSAVEYMLSFL